MALNEVPPQGPVGPSDIAPVSLEDEMRKSYLDYAMSVIVARALPDVRDGLKPVHRRILYAMREGGYSWNQPFRKSARIVGDVMGKYHPHGDAAIYDAMVRMAQPFSMRLPLISGQGNFGSQDNDPPAAMRYTEARLAQASEALLADIDRDTVDFQPNYDDSDREPVALPAEFPNLLVNGAGGIAVGMATNIPTHNLGEVINACLAYIDDPDITVDGLMQHIPGPDFPTGGVVIGRGGIRQAYETGRGSVIVRARHEIEPRPGDREAIVVTEVPYQVNKARMIERISEVVGLKLVDGIQALRDESDRRGIRVVIELKRDVSPEVVLNQLHKHTQMQVSFSANMLALDGGRPEVLPLRRIIQAFVEFREEVITRRTTHELGKARERAHVLVGLAVAVANIDEVIRIIRAAADPAEAQAGLLERQWPVGDIAPLLELIDERAATSGERHYRLSETQARAILDLRLHRLTGLERERIAEELTEVSGRIREYLEILGSRERLLEVMREELRSVRDRFADARRSTLDDVEIDQDMEDLIQREDMVVTVSRGGYIKRVPLSTYRAQRRGGKGRAGMSIREEDVVSQVFVANTHTPILFFSSAGIVYKLKVYRLPEGTPQARGRKMQQVIQDLPPGDWISTVMPFPGDGEVTEDSFVMFATASGRVRRNALSDFVNVMARGKIAMKLEEGDTLVGVAPCGIGDHVLLATGSGKAIRFPVSEVRRFQGRNSSGNRGIALAGDDRVISMSILDGAEFTPEERDAYLRQADDGTTPPERVDELRAHEQMILTVASDGYGKRTSAYDYRVTRRGGQGIALMGLPNGEVEVVAAFPVGEGDQLVLVTDGGQLIRCPVADIRIARRITRGVRLFNVADGERVVSVSHLAEDVDDEGEQVPDGTGEDA